MEASAVRGQVLLVEDDAILRALMVRMFVRAGIHPDVAMDGEEAIQLLGLGNYQLVLLDLMLPRVSGFDVLEYMRTAPSIGPRIVVVCTAALDTAIEHLDPALVHGVLRKPFEMDDLIGFIDAVAKALTPGPVGAEPRTQAAVTHRSGRS